MVRTKLANPLWRVVCSNFGMGKYSIVRYGELQYSSVKCGNNTVWRGELIFRLILCGRIWSGELWWPQLFFAGLWWVHSVLRNNKPRHRWVR